MWGRQNAKDCSTAVIQLRHFQALHHFVTHTGEEPRSEASNLVVTNINSDIQVNLRTYHSKMLNATLQLDIQHWPRRWIGMTETHRGDGRSHNSKKFCKVKQFCQRAVHFVTYVSPSHRNWQPPQISNDVFILKNHYFWQQRQIWSPCNSCFGMKKENVEILKEMAKDANLHGNPQVNNTHTQVEWSIFITLNTTMQGIRWPAKIFKREDCGWTQTFNQ